MPDTISIVVFEGLDMALLTAGEGRDVDFTGIGRIFPIDTVELDIGGGIAADIIALVAFLFVFKFKRMSEKSKYKTANYQKLIRHL